MQEQDPALLEEFVVENTQSLQDFEQDLLSLEETGASTEIINKMFRAIHSLKGSSGYLGLRSILEVSHLGETLLDEVRKKQRELTPDIVDLLLRTNDALRSMVESDDFGAGYDTSEILQSLEEVVSVDSSGQKAGEEVDVAGSAAETVTIGEYELSAATVDCLKFICSLPFDPKQTEFIGTQLAEGKYAYWLSLPLEASLEIASDLSDVGVVAAKRVEPPQLLLLTVLDKEMVSVSSGVVSDYIELIPQKILLDAYAGNLAQFSKPAAGENSTSHHQGKSVKDSAPVETAAAATTDSIEPKSTSSRKKDKSDDGAMIKIHARFLDELLRLTGNMVMSRNQLLNRYNFSDDSAFATLSRAITEVHRGVVQTRMKPVSSLFDRFRRVVRDLSKQLGKHVELRTEGGSMELDRTILEAFVDPLMHMVRNSIDHGIEDEAQRQKSAKPHIATVTLKAFQESGEIIIAVCDDGRGIDLSKIKAKALERGMITPAQLENIPDNKALMLIFEAGFSTAQKLSEVSGRGVGMDVVKTNIEAIGGVLDCQSELGKGTTIQARLPLTKAMVASSLIAALVVKVGEHRLCIPQSAVNELIRVTDKDRQDKVRTLQGQEVFQHRELVVPIIPLNQALEVASSAEQKQGIASGVSAQTLIVLQHRNNLVGMMVDEIIGIEEAVVRELPRLAVGSSVFSGHTVLGDGQVVMLVDIGGVVERMNMKFPSGLKKVENNLPALSVGKRSDRQTMIIFNYAENENFAVPLELVSLVEKIRATEIRCVGDRCYYPFKGNTIPLLYLDKHLPVTAIPRDLDYYNLILPARVKYPIGLITNTNISVHDISEKFDSRITHDKGVLGTFMHMDKLVMLLDLYALFENDDPDHFDTSVKETCSSARILIVEDSLFYRKLNTTYLSGPGRMLTVRNDGREALTELRQNPHSYDIIVTDIEMPNMNGFELVKAIRGDPLLQKLPVIALTALQDEASRERGMRMGFDEYVVKVDKDSLTSVVEQYAQRVQQGETSGVIESGVQNADSVVSY